MSDQSFYNQFNTNSPQDQQKWNEWVFNNMNQGSGPIAGSNQGSFPTGQPVKEKLPVGYLIAVILLSIIIVVQIIFLVRILRSSSSAHSTNPNEVSYISSVMEYNEFIEAEPNSL